MSASVKIFVAAGAAAFLSACTGHLTEAETAAPPVDAFAAALQSGYVALARAERDENDFEDARSFAARALDSANGRPPAPEDLGARRLPQESVPELADARGRLMRALDAGARGLSPRDAAEAQLGLDCWMQEQEENFQPADIAACRGRFLVAAARLESLGLAAREPDPAAPRAIPATLEGRLRTNAPPAARFVIYFGLDDANLSQAAKQEIAQAADAARRTGAALVRITGHADRAGTELHNLALSRARAVSVANALRRLGLPPTGVATLARGEAEPLVATGDGVPEARNRRVEIDLAR